MSWIDYVNGYLVNWTDPSGEKTYTNNCEHGAIIGNTDGTVWASTPGFGFGIFQVETDKEDGSGTLKVEVNEFANLNDAFNNNGQTNKAGGLRINNEKYYMVSFDGEKNVMYLKKNGGGACVAKSNLGYVIGTFNSSKKFTLNGKENVQNPGICNLVTEKLQEFLVSNNL
jgi:profilin